MATLVNFSGNGIAFAKKRKVMPGTNKNLKPEMEQVNWVKANSENDTDRVAYATTIVFPTTAVAPSGTYRVWDWIPLPMPLNSMKEGGRKGSKVIYRYARFKGYIMVTNHLACSTRWRMVLYRVEDFEVSTPTDINANYPKVYHFWTNTELSQDLDFKEAAWVDNYHLKVARIDAKTWCRHKVIASGVIPRTLSMSQFTSVGVVGDGEVALRGAVQNNVTSGNTEFDEVIHIPIDVKVKLDDTVDFSVSYFLAIEMDNPTSVYFSQTTQDLTRIQTATGSAVKFIFFTRLYFEDY